MIVDVYVAEQVESVVDCDCNFSADVDLNFLKAAAEGEMVLAFV